MYYFKHRIRILHYKVILKVLVDLLIVPLLKRGLSLINMGIKGSKRLT